jgi:serine/threonine protein kinase
VGEKLDKISGTSGYIAPELFLSKTDRFANVKSDIYSMGLVLYEMYDLIYLV